MGCSSCRGGGGGKASSPTQTIINAEAAKAQATSTGLVLLEYIGGSMGTRTYRPPRPPYSGQTYRFGGDQSHKRNFVYGQDVPFFAPLPDFRIVDQEQAKKPEPEAAPAAPPVRQKASRLEVASA